MSTTKELYEFLIEHALDMTHAWLDSRVEEDSIYSKDAPEHITKRMIEQNQRFIRTVAKSLIEEVNYTEWAEELAINRAKSGTPLFTVIENFKKFRVIFNQFITKFAVENKSFISYEQLGEWNTHVNYIFDVTIEQFTLHYHKANEEVLKLQKDLLLELSTPVISISPKVGILPLIGDIDTYRAKVIKEQTLQQCNHLQLECLIMDLSGVPYIDTMVANELFQVITTLSLLGIKGILTGIRPEIAQTAVQLGIDFGKVKTYGKLQQALPILFKDYE